MAMSLAAYVEPPDPTHFVAQQRSLYVPAGDVGYWQGAIRDGDTDRGDADALRRAIESPRAHSRCSCATPIRTAVTTRSPATRSCPDENGDWLFGIGRHWSL